MSTPRSLDALVEHQVRRWDIERRPGMPRPRGPCVALSRQPGSGGASLGRRIAEWLDYGFFGIEIVDQIAREQGIQRRLVTGLDEHLRGVIDRYVADAFRSRPFTEGDYLQHVVRTVATLGERGMAVILGRGAAFILPPEQALRVLVVAPTPARIERLVKARGLSTEEGVKRLEQEDDDRLAFLRHHFGVEADDPRLYDLVVNTGTFGIDAAAALVVEALRRRFPANQGAG
jgi:cytidylate kinase